MTGRVLYVCLHPSSPGEAAATHVDNIVENLRALGWEVTVHRVVHAVPTGVLGRLSRWLTVQARVVTSLHGTDVVYVRSHPAAVLTVAAARFLGIPTVQEVNGPDEDYLLAWPSLRRIPWVVTGPVRWQLRVAHAVVTVTDGLRAWAEERTGRPGAWVVPNGVDVERFRAARAVEATAPPYVAFVGALAPWQGIRLLLAATRHRNWPADVSLVVAGDGSHRDLVRTAARESAGRIRWLGSIPHHDVPALLAGSEAAVVTSQDRHGTGVSPLKLYEAMAAGVAIIVPEVAGAAGTVRTEGCGIVVPADDAGALADAVRRLHADAQMRTHMGARGRRAAVERHSWMHRAHATARILEDVMGAERRAS